MALAEASIENPSGAAGVRWKSVSIGQRAQPLPDKAPPGSGVFLAVPRAVPWIWSREIHRGSINSIIVRVARLENYDADEAAAQSSPAGGRRISDHRRIHHPDAARACRTQRRQREGKCLYIFNSVHSAMRQWGSSLRHNGLGLIPATVPEDTLLYHGTPRNSTPETFEWLAFEIEHAENFAGTLDTQDLLLRDLTEAPGFGEWERAADMCKLGADMLRRPHSEAPESKGLMDAFEWLRATAERYDGIGAGRAHLDFSGMVSALWYPVNTTNPAGGQPRLSETTREERAAMRRRVAEIVVSRAGGGVDWQGVVDLIIARHERRIGYLADPDADAKDFASQVFVLTNAFIDYPSLPSDIVDKTAGDETVIADARRRCAAHYLALPRASRVSWTKEDEMLDAAVEAVTARICDDFFSVRSFLLANHDAVSSPGAVGSGELSREDSLERARSIMRTLKRDLDWTAWKKCGACNVNEVCFVAIWPFGLVEDHYAPSSTKNHLSRRNMSLHVECIQISANRQTVYVRTRHTINGIPSNFRARRDPTAPASFGSRLVNFCTETATTSPTHSFRTINDLAEALVLVISSLWDEWAISVERRPDMVIEFWHEEPTLVMGMVDGDEAEEGVFTEEPVDALVVYETVEWGRYFKCVDFIDYMVLHPRKFHRDREGIYHELRVLANMPAHPNIVEPPRTLTYVMDTTGGNYSIRISGALYLYTDHHSIDTQMKMRAGDRDNAITLAAKARWCHQMAIAVQYTYRVANTFHGDVKPANFLISEEREVVLANWKQRGPVDLITAAPEIVERWPLDELRDPRADYDEVVRGVYAQLPTTPIAHSSIAEDQNFFATWHGIQPTARARRGLQPRREHVVAAPRYTEPRRFGGACRRGWCFGGELAGACGVGRGGAGVLGKEPWKRSEMDDVVRFWAVQRNLYEQTVPRYDDIVMRTG
ncbi:unnamed protein product [Parascedosporium putredinis]|uniref:Protein kinase domain-containing protein n=1 Tax=Parascedosporium putredinis TaxID=1442378 RepID=A0A9P1MAT0_9PEZI|nr:unnamed protein product [Parascedosporium putredinis]CAI7993341.1 unnamed protein product [Parascedosporium putredinis]